jgi:hypothetical protein
VAAELDAATRTIAAALGSGGRVAAGDSPLHESDRAQRDSSSSSERIETSQPALPTRPRRASGEPGRLFP